MEKDSYVDLYKRLLNKVVNEREAISVQMALNLDQIKMKVASYEQRLIDILLKKEELEDEYK